MCGEWLSMCVHGCVCGRGEWLSVCEGVCVCVCVPTILRDTICSSNCVMTSLSTGVLASLPLGSEVNRCRKRVLEIVKFKLRALKVSYQNRPFFEKANSMLLTKQNINESNN